MLPRKHSINAGEERTHLCSMVNRPVTPSSSFPTRNGRRPWRLALLAGLFGAFSTVLPLPAAACGWWGDAEGDASRDAVAIGRDGSALAGEAPASETPEALTRQANRLRRFGFSGYAGALRLYRQAAEASFAPAQNNLAAMYEEGLGVATDLAEAVHWYRLAAEQDEPHAQHSLGMMLIEGRGITADREAGRVWVERAAQQGHASACAELGKLYTTGNYLRKDVQKAIYWWQLAERQGYPEAIQALKALRRLQPGAPVIETPQSTKGVTP